MNRMRWFVVLFPLLGLLQAEAQVNTVQFGKNRVQYQKFKWKYHQTDNFNCYFSQDGLGLGEYVGQIAEQELPGLEAFIKSKWQWVLTSCTGLSPLDLIFSSRVLRSSGK